MCQSTREDGVYKYAYNRISIYLAHFKILEYSLNNLKRNNWLFLKPDSKQTSLTVEERQL